MVHRDRDMSVNDPRVTIAGLLARFATPRGKMSVARSRSMNGAGVR